MRGRYQVLLTSLFLSWPMLACSCSPTEPPSGNAVSARAEEKSGLIPTGELMDDQIAFQFAIFYLPRPASEPLAELDALLNGKFSGVRQVETIDGPEESPALAARMVSDPKREYAPPDLESLRYFGRGLSRDQAEALQDSEAVLILDWAYSQDHVWTGLRSAVELTASLARSTGGLIWDETTREIFSPDAWNERRIDGWTEEIPDVTKHTVIHAYKKHEYVRAITLGMEKFGLPDVVIDNFSWSLNRNMGHVVNLFAQAIAEGATGQRPGEFDLDLKAVRNPDVREPQIAALKPNATGILPLSLRKGTWEEGDPINRLIEITFDRGIGPDIHAKQEHILIQAFGWEDDITNVSHDAALEAASRQARAKLPALQAEFNEGLAPGEFILVKAPFATPDAGREWMWVEVTSWNGDSITGLLKNEPFQIPNLHAGQIVEVSEADVFDYIRRHADGTSEGNETGKLIEQRGQ